MLIVEYDDRMGVDRPPQLVHRGFLDRLGDIEAADFRTDMRVKRRDRESHDNPPGGRLMLIAGGSIGPSGVSIGAATEAAFARSRNPLCSGRGFLAGVAREMPEALVHSNT